MTPPHPAVYSAALYDIFLAILAERCRPGATVLDPMAGTGGIHRLRDHGYQTVGVEIEKEWAEASPWTLNADAMSLPFRSETFDAIITSPTFGNRMADHHEAKDGSYRRTYRHLLGRPLAPQSTGSLQWGSTYRVIHTVIWLEAYRVLRPGGTFVLDIKDHIRNLQRAHVSDWHFRYLRGLGLRLDEVVRPELPGFLYGENRELRLPERVLVFTKPVTLA